MKLLFRLARALKRDRCGSVATEFALLATPFCILIFACINSILTSSGEYLLINQSNKAVRMLSTEQWTSRTDITKEFCKGLGALFDCTSANKQRLYIDIRSFSDLRNLPGDPVPDGADPSLTALKIEPGGKGSLNILRVYYIWDTKIDMIRPLLSGINKGSKRDNSIYLMRVNDIYHVPSQ